MDCVQPPAAGVPILQKHTSVVCVDRYQDCSPAQPRYDVPAWGIAIGGGAIPELTIAVEAPAGEVPIVEDCAGVVPIRANLSRGPPCPQARCLGGGRSMCVSSIPQLPVVVVPPTNYASIVQDRARVLLPSRYLDCGSPKAQ